MKSKFNSKAETYIFDLFILVAILNSHYSLKSIAGTHLCTINSVVRLLEFHNRSSKIIVQEVSIDDQL